MDEELKILLRRDYTTTENAGGEILPRFRWLDTTGAFHWPDEMETGHLFYTVRMIWNHTMPMKLEPYNKYSFGPAYTREYLVKAIRAMVPCLGNRTNLEEGWKKDLKRIVDFLSTFQIESHPRERIENND